MQQIKNVIRVLQNLIITKRNDESIMSDMRNNSKCENCGSTSNLFKITILSPCREHSHTEVYCNEHATKVIKELPEDIESI